MTKHRWILMMDDGWVHSSWFKTRKAARIIARAFKRSPYVARNKIRVIKVLS